MEKGVNPDLFVNDGSFMEKFKQLQQDKVENTASEGSKTCNSTSSVSVKPIALANKRPLGFKSTEAKKPSASGSSGKLAFSLKQKSKISAVPVILAEDEEEDRVASEAVQSDDSAKRQKVVQLDASKSRSEKGHAPVPPSVPTVKNAADKLASFVAKNGRHFEDITRQKNPGDTPFKFLFDSSCSDYKYYEYRLFEEEKILGKNCDSESAYSEASNGAISSKTPTGSKWTPTQQNSNFQTPASALYGIDEEPAASMGKNSVHGESSGPSSSDPIAVMEYYMKKAAQEERKRQPRQSKDEMPPPASLHAPPTRKGHHMGDFIPLEELEKFLASCNDAAAEKAAKEYAARSRIQPDNVGHKLLSKMGWKEGEGLGSSRAGRADPVLAGSVKLNNLGVGAENPGQVTAEDDIYEQYKKRMMLGYKYRPNPLNNPRKSYY